jgi:hypothetical protein
MPAITRSHFIVTPGIELLPNSFLVQNLIRERVRAVLMAESNVDFKQLAGSWVMRYIPAPEFSPDNDGSKYQAWLKKETDTVVKAFHKYEENVAYQESIKQLKVFEGQMFSINSVTQSGIMVLITDPDGKSSDGY